MPAAWHRPNDTFSRMCKGPARLIEFLRWRSHLPVIQYRFVPAQRGLQKGLQKGLQNGPQKGEETMSEQIC